MYNNLKISTISRKIQEELSVSFDSKEIHSKINEKMRPILVFSFDDGYESDYEIVHPILQKNGIRGSFYINGGSVGDNLLMNETQLKGLADAGHEIGCHTYSHVDLSVASDEELLYEWSTNIEYLEGVTGKKVYTHAYPLGRRTDRVDNLAGGFFEATRGTSWNQFESPFTDHHILTNLYGRRTFNLGALGGEMSNPATHIDIINRWLALPEPTVLILYGHRVFADGESKPDDRAYASQLEEVVEYVSGLKEQGKIDIVPFIEAARRIQSATSAHL